MDLGPARVCSCTCSRLRDWTLQNDAEHWVMTIVRYDMSCQILFVVLGCTGTPDPVMITIRLARLGSTKQFYGEVLPLITKNLRHLTAKRPRRYTGGYRVIFLFFSFWHQISPFPLILISPDRDPSVLHQSLTTHVPHHIIPIFSLICLPKEQKQQQKWEGEEKDGKQDE